MVVFEWNDKYAFNVPTIDEDHKKLIEGINRAFEVMSERSGEGIYDLLAQLRAEALEHHEREENYMREVQYPGIEAHTKSHDDFIKRLLRFENCHLESDINLSIKVTVFLNTWLHDHLLGEDRALFRHSSAPPPPSGVLL